MFQTSVRRGIPLLILFASLLLGAQAKRSDAYEEKNGKVLFHILAEGKLVCT